MFRRLSILAVVLALAVSAGAELRYTQANATSSSQTVTIISSELIIVNDGSGSVYIRIFYGDETPAAATTANAEIKSGESFTARKDLQIRAVSLICASGQTATVRLFY